jgi:excisionase family DNA binding protein
MDGGITMEKKYLTLKETAALTNTAYATIKRDIDNAVLPAYKVGRKYFIAAADAEDYAIIRRELASISGYTIKELLEILPLSYAFIIEEIKKNNLKAVKCGRRFIIPEAELERYLEEAKI